MILDSAVPDERNPFARVEGSVSVPGDARKMCPEHLPVVAGDAAVALVVFPPANGSGSTNPEKIWSADVQIWHALDLIRLAFAAPRRSNRQRRPGLSVQTPRSERCLPGVDQPMTWVPFCQPRASSAVSIALPGRTARKPVTMWFAGDGSLANAAGIGNLPPVKALVSLGIVWLCVGVALTLAARFSSMERRPHFWVRFSIVVLAPPA
jgi:hypothetical protein